MRSSAAEGKKKRSSASPRLAQVMPVPHFVNAFFSCRSGHARVRLRHNLSGWCAVTATGFNTHTRLNVCLEKLLHHSCGPRFVAPFHTRVLGSSLSMKLEVTVLVWRCNGRLSNRTMRENKYYVEEKGWSTCKGISINKGPGPPRVRHIWAR